MSKSNELNNISDIFHFVTDKAVLDFVNGLQVADELNDKNLHNQSFIQRVLGFTSGKSLQTQANINDHVHAGLEACRSYINTILVQQSGHANTLIQLKHSIDDVQHHLAEVIDSFGAEIDGLRSDLNMAVSRIDRLECHKDAIHQRDLELSKLGADDYDMLPLAGQCFAVLDNLYRGDFGLYLRDYASRSEASNMVQILKNQLSKEIASKHPSKGLKDDFRRDEWFLPLPSQSSSQNKDTDFINESLAYMGSWSCNQPTNHNEVYFITQYHQLSDEERDKNFFPHMVSPDVLVARLIESMNQNFVN